MSAHHEAQRAIVRMLYDRGFAEAVHRDPIAAGVPPEVARLLVTPAGARIDPRALRADGLRARRTLGVLIEELKGASLIALDECRSIALLEGFFTSPEFHRAVDEETPLVPAFGRFLDGLCAAGTLKSPLLPPVLALELMQAQARREAAPVVPRVEGSPAPERVRLAPGVRFARIAPEALAVQRAVEQLLFEQSLVAGIGLCADGPRLRLPSMDPEAAPLPLVAVAHEGGLSVVTVDEETAALIEPLSAAGILAASALVGEATRRGLEPARAEALLVELCDQEVLCAAPPAAAVGAPQ